MAAADYEPDGGTPGRYPSLVEQARAGTSPREIAEQLGAEVYEKTQLLPLKFFQKSCSGLVKQSLRQEGLSDE